MSVFPLKADMLSVSIEVRFVPIATLIMVIDVTYWFSFAIIESIRGIRRSWALSSFAIPYRTTRAHGVICGQVIAHSTRLRSQKR